ncbi:hypothetical protein [Flavobacterium hibernum]|uniref:Uncharacterized protein n=1 Tax=Flavobacterium hibernum TaxID=37752 RepID=A0A0D0EES6_9FLAO|nr:hypothetical protein [Flavobacterium hibernum]KIO52869.1 hypothetical protein IW18_10050 [Flavobacterium hibernum]OXA88511.1 hypothetical protein B0A73_07460 [Flavobacterium hibernum]STO15360.1 Uncharacterised protein [Flavobacterium hibernum]
MYYKLYSRNDSLIGFSIRKYEFRKDTIIEKYLSISLNGKKNNAYLRDFYRKGTDIYIFSNIQNDKSRYMFFSPTLKDTCYFVDRKLDNFYLCTKGKVNFKNYKNVYKVYYDEGGYDSRKETLILDKDYTVIARFEDCYDYRKEIILEKNQINVDLKIKLKKAEEKILWW